MRLPVLPLAAVSVAACLAACGTPPVTRLHTLLSGDAPAAPGASQTAARVVEVLPVAIPEPADGPQWIVRAADDSLVALEHERWAAPLRDELRRALVERLVTQWGATDAATLPPTGRAPVWRVKVDVQRFESLPGREAWLEATWSVMPPAGSAPAVAAPAPTCHASLHAPVGSGVPALEAGHRRNAAALADRIGTALANGGACPSP